MLYHIMFCSWAAFPVCKSQCSHHILLSAGVHAAHETAEEANEAHTFLFFPTDAVQQISISVWNGNWVSELQENWEWGQTRSYLFIIYSFLY